MGLEDALIKAMEELPEGWSIQIEVERGSVQIELLGPQEHVLRLQYCSTKHLFTCINQAIAQAKKES